MIDRLPPHASQALAPAAKPARNAKGGFAEWLKDAAERPASLDPERVATEAAKASGDEFPSQEAGQDLDVQLQVRRGTGELEILSLPWRLAANTALSQLSMRSVAVGLPGSAGAAQGAAGSASHHFHGAVSTSPAWSAPAAAEGQASPLRHPMFHTAATVGMSDEGASSTHGAASAAALPWLARVVRWLEQKGHDPAIWIRDYRLDHASAQQLVEALRIHAQEQGIRLERVVVNGQELWSAGMTHQPETHDAR